MNSVVRAKSPIFFWLKLALLLVLVAACIKCAVGDRYSSPEMRARVVTPHGAPIKGAIVVATWRVNSLLHGSTIGQLAVLEAVTDASGQFRIPAWGPKYVKKGTVNIDEPVVRIFYPGYVPMVLKNSDGVGMRSAHSVIHFRLQDQALVLEPFVGTPDEYAEAMFSLDYYLSFVIFDPRPRLEFNCYWKAMPNMLMAVERVRLDLERSGVGHLLHSLRSFVLASGSHCGDPKSVFQELWE